MHAECGLCRILPTMQDMPMSMSVKLAAYSHSAADSPKKVRVQKHPQKSLSSPTTHVTETRFLHVLDPPDHFGTIYIFDDFFTFGLSFFPTNFPEKSWRPRPARGRGPA